MDIIEFLNSVLNIEGKLAPSGWYRACCPIHGESSPSFAVYTEYPYHYKCLSCGAGGQLPYLTAQVLKIPLTTATELVLEKLKIVIRVDNLFPKKRVAEPIPQPLLDAYTAALRDSRTARYCRSRGIPRFVLESFGVGHDQLNLQMVIPVRSLVTGEVIGFDTRGFLSESEPVEKSSTLPEGGKSVAGILPFDYKQKRNIVVVEGFFDAARTYMWLLRERLNYTVVAFGGVSITPQQMEFLSGYDRIAVGYDLDSAGIRGGNKLLKELSYAPLQQLTFTGKDPGETPLDEFGLKIYI